MRNSDRKRSALVTGGASGIGWATVKTLASLGWGIYVVDRKCLRADQLRPNVTMIRADVTEVRRFESSLDSLPTKLDAVVLCAAESPFLPDSARIIRTNCCAAIHNVLACQELLKQNASIILIGGTAGFRVKLSNAWVKLRRELLRGEKCPTLPHETATIDSKVAYWVAKTVVMQSVNPLARLFAQRRIRVNCVAPGPTLTGMTLPVRRSFPKRWTEFVEEAPFRRANTAAEVGAAIAFLCEDAARNITGSTLHIDGGWYVENRT